MKKSISICIIIRSYVHPKTSSWFRIYLLSNCTLPVDISFIGYQLKGGENMHTFILKQFPMILRSVDPTNASKILGKLNSEYGKGIDEYNRFIDAHRSGDAYPSYLG